MIPFPFAGERELEPTPSDLRRHREGGGGCARSCERTRISRPDTGLAIAAQWVRAIHLGQSYPVREARSDVPATELPDFNCARLWIGLVSSRSATLRAMARDLHRRARVVPDPSKSRCPPLGAAKSRVSP